MKKIMLTIMMMTGIASISAQVMEPLVPRDSNLFYQWGYEEILADSITLYLNDMGASSSYGFHPWNVEWLVACGEIAEYMYTDTTMAILGVRILGNYRSDAFPPNFHPNKCHVRIYEIENGNMVEAAKKHIFEHYPDHIQRTSVDEYHNNINSFNFRIDDTVCDDPYVHRLVHPPYFDYYFDEPALVNDSFYVAVDFLTEQWEATTLLVCAHCSTLGDSCDKGIEDPFPLQHFKYRPAYQASPTDLSTVFMDWRDTNMHCFAYMLPIVKYGTPYSICTPVEGLHVSHQKDSTFFFEWSDTTVSHLGWEFTYVPDGQSPDAGTAVSCDSAEASATVTQGVRYRAFARPRCVGQRYGDWGDGVPFIYSDGETSIAQAEKFVSVRPNPTSSTVEVNSEMEMKAVEVFDNRGVKVMESQADGRHLQLDLSSLPTGTYLLRIHTTNGTATRQIVKS